MCTEKRRGLCIAEHSKETAKRTIRVHEGTVSEGKHIKSDVFEQDGDIQTYLDIEENYEKIGAV